MVCLELERRTSGEALADEGEGEGGAIQLGLGGAPLPEDAEGEQGRVSQEKGPAKGAGGQQLEQGAAHGQHEQVEGGRYGEVRSKPYRRFASRCEARLASPDYGRVGACPAEPVG